MHYKNTTTMKKIYTRSIDAGHGTQKITVVDGKFDSLETYPNGPGYYTKGSFEPADYEKGKPIPRGFLAKYRFKRHYPIGDEEKFYLQIP